MRPACIDADPEAFFPEKGGDVLPGLRICLEICAVVNGDAYLDACIAKAVREMETSKELDCVGVRGGLSGRQIRNAVFGAVTVDGVATVDGARAKNRKRLGLVSA